MTLPIALLVTSSLIASGCASVRPQSRVIDATNKQPWFERSVEKEVEKTNHKDKWDDEKLEKHKETTNTRKTTYDFTF